MLYTYTHTNKWSFPVCMLPRQRCASPLSASATATRTWTVRNDFLPLSSPRSTPAVNPLTCIHDRHGIALLLTYKLGSSRMPESHKYIVNLKWLGLRPLQVPQEVV